MQIQHHFDSKGKFVGELLNSNPLLAQREPHGIKYEKDEKDGGKEYLYHTNPGWEDWWSVLCPSFTIVVCSTRTLTRTEGLASD